MRGGLRARTEKQKHHRYHLLALMRPPSFSTRTSSAIRPSPPCRAQPQALLQIAPHRPDAREQTHEAKHAVQAGKTVRPGDEPRPVGGRQAEQLANDGQWQLPRIALDHIGGTSILEQPGRKLVGDGENSRLHVEDGAASKGLVDDAAQPRVIGLVHGQHADRERTYPPRHPPAQTGNRAFRRIVNVSLSFRTRPAKSLVVVIQVFPMIGNRVLTTGPQP